MRVRRPSELERLGVFLVSMGLTRLLVRRLDRPTPAPAPNAGPIPSPYRHRYGADTPEAN